MNDRPVKENFDRVHRWMFYVRKSTKYIEDASIFWLMNNECVMYETAQTTKQVEEEQQ